MNKQEVGSILSNQAWMFDGLVTDAEGAEVGIHLIMEVEGKAPAYKVVFPDYELLAPVGLRTYKPIAAIPPNELSLKGNFTTIPGTIVAQFADGTDLTALVLLNEDSGLSPTEPPIGTIAIRNNSSVTGSVRWIYSEPKPWHEVFAEYLNLIAFKTKGRESSMFNESRAKPREVCVDRPRADDPMQQKAMAAKEMIESFFGNGDFVLNLNLEGRTLANGDRELTGGFTFTIKGESE